MSQLYRGLWPQVVGTLAKYSVRFIDGAWRVTVLYAADEGLRFLAVEGDAADLVDKINEIKVSTGGQPGGTFYINEYRHVLVPVGDHTASRQVPYHYAGRYGKDFHFDFEGKTLTTKPVDAGGEQLAPGKQWFGPRPGIPYVLAAGGTDIYFETPALTDADPPDIRPRMTRRVQLSRVLKDKGLLSQAVAPVFRIRGYQGGRFYVNEHGAIFTPVGAHDGNGLDYIYCGEIDRKAWFPEPAVPF
ncbi:hypothetical protein [Geomonas anaerohicana]|uniref:Uncharacterized protein n=1 Tax=Geomonas anaerohicana TaxID=2798583 RepID=A0ABS0YC67_9BACT|nr:hypothetical protein [Geomonas anaerohicana]MBJ6749891.1 hypothetical protein [Geomonas anaerohicana]